MAKNSAAVALGRLGGRSRSAKKQAAVRENGKKGGRPKKLTLTTSPTTEIVLGPCDKPQRTGFWTRYTSR